MEDVNKKLDAILEKLTYTTDLFNRRLLNDKEKNALISRVSEHLTVRENIDNNLLLSGVFKELLLVIDRLDQDDNDFNKSIAEEIKTIFTNRGFEEIAVTIDSDKLLYEVVSVEDAEENKFEMIKPAYRIGNKIVRPAKVKLYRNRK